MKIGYGINRRVSDFAKAGLDLDGFQEPRVWIDTDIVARPAFSEMLMGLESGDVVVVLALSDLGKGGFGQSAGLRMVEANGGTVEVVDSATPPPAPRKPGPKPRWPEIDAQTIKDGAAMWFNPDIYAPGAALKVFHDAGFGWVTRNHLNSNLGPRNGPKSKESSDAD